MKNSISILSVLIALAIVPSISCSAVSKTKPPTVPVIAKPKAKPGTILWEWISPKGVPVYGPSLGHDGKLYTVVKDMDAPMWSIDRVTGKTHRNYQIRVHRDGGTIYPCVSLAITPAGSLVCPLYGSGRLLSIPQDFNGTSAWEHRCGYYNSTSAALSGDGVAYYGNEDKQFYAIDLKSGKVNWKYITKNSIYGTAVVCQRGDVYFGSTDGVFYALNGETGKLKWQYKNDEISRYGHRYTTQDPIIDERGWIYVTCFKEGAGYGTMLALNSETGELKWSEDFDKSGTIYSPAMGKGGTLYASHGSSIFAINRDTGKMIWQTDRNLMGDVRSALTIGDDGTLYCHSRDRFIYALDSKTRKIKWRVKTGASSETPALIDNVGNLYVGSNDGRLYAIATSSTGPAKSPWPMYGQNAQRTHRAPATK
jgi:outer membrane protein assembly factor BamB